MHSPVEEAIQNLVNHGVVRPCGEYRNGQMVYELVPDAELSNEARAYLRRMREDHVRVPGRRKRWTPRRR